MSESTTEPESGAGDVERLAPPGELEKQGYRNLTGLVEVVTEFPVMHGGYCDIYLGHVIGQPTWKVAIKVFRKSRKQSREQEAIELRKYVNRQAAVGQRLRHKNVLTFLGLANDLGRHGCPALVSPYCRNGTARSYIERLHLLVKDRLRLILGLARGLEYLHEKHIIHKNISPSNVLVSDNGEALLGGFGRSSILDIHGFTTKPSGAVRYGAPEYLLESSIPNKSADVYSLGSTAFEFWTGVRPFNEFHSDVRIIFNIMTRNAKPQLPSPPPAMADSLWPIFRPCYDTNPENRPTIQEIIRQLELCIPLVETSGEYEAGVSSQSHVLAHDSDTDGSNAMGQDLEISDDGDRVDEHEEYESVQILAPEDQLNHELQSHSSIGVSTDLRPRCRALMLEVATGVAQKKLSVEETGAQLVVDFLSKELLDDGNMVLSRSERKSVLQFLSKLIKLARVFPLSLRLENVQCDLSHPITEGGFGYIYKAFYNARPVCVKTVRIFEQHKHYEQRLRAQAGEVTLWAHLRHENILPFLGIYISDEKWRRVCIVSPWMENGDLHQYLRDHLDVPLIPLLHDIIAGLHYLHELDIVHADLKAKNVLVSGTRRAIIADFGISRVSMTLTTTTAYPGVGTTYWMAPELLLDENSIPKKQSDIWAFGCVCYEVLSGKMPFDQFSRIPQLIRAFMKGNTVPLKVVLEPSPRSDENEKIWPLAEQCWDYAPESRPTSEVLLESFSRLNMLDDRPADEEASPRKNTGGDIDYDRVYGVLEQIRESNVRNRKDEQVGEEREAD